MVRFGIGKVAKNEDGWTWNQTPDERFRIEVDPNKGVDPMNDQILEGFLSSVRNAPRSVRQSFFLNLFVFSDSKVLAFSTKSGRAVLRDLDYNWVPISIASCSRQTMCHGKCSEPSQGGAWSGISRLKVSLFGWLKLVLRETFHFCPKTCLMQNYKK